ncbi:MAG TPA: allophanate hydrolase [Aquabacterium sp.]|uniref:allophanate hydrolase n=1 Tax=Aquabacterium sp. TaxID=1872578 RepID=UPI002E347E12|nr:allophanate hydrolase [Aquabacterium sp.]HEX5373088.1 allophanate hydrolase [Aquabacterium sp.]
MNTTPHTIAGLLAAYRDGRLSPQEVLRPFIEAADRADRVAPHDPAWISRATPGMIETQLRQLEGQSPATLPLYGIPFAVKDNIDVAGLPTTAACPAYAYTPAQSATAVRRLMAAGAIMVGKTNLDQFATGLVGARSPYGVPSSTFSAQHVSGGSSSGSAVVVSRGDLPFALGTDTAGSGRVPAGFNNLVGLKPTPGLVPTTGVVPACKTLDCVSIFALTVADAARVLAVMEGPEAGAPVFHAVNWQPPRWPTQSPLRVGVPRTPEFFGDAAYAQAFERARAQWSQLQDREGHAWPVELVPLDLAPFSAVARLLYEGPWVAERYAAIRGFIDTQADQMNPVVRGIVEGARQYDAASAFEAIYRLKTLAAQTASIWQGIDVLMVPTAPTHPTQVAVQSDPVGCNAQLGTYTNFVNLLGLAALALPASVLDHGLPFGITLIAPGGSDAALADLGACWQQCLAATGRHTLGHGLAEPSDLDLAWPEREPHAEPTLSLAVVGAHLQGMPLHGQLVERRARLIEATHTAPCYQLHALPGTVPPKPGLARIAADAPPDTGHAIAVEVYALPLSQVGSFLALIPPPLGLGSVELADGRWVKGFICEPAGLQGALDISHFGGWRAYMAQRAADAQKAA